MLLKPKDVLRKPKSGTKIEQRKFSLGSHLQTAIAGTESRRVAAGPSRSPLGVACQSGRGPAQPAPCSVDGALQTPDLVKPLAVVT